MSNKSFGEILRELRKEKKISLRNLGIKSGISHAYLSQLENNKRGTPKPETLKKIAEGLKIPYSELMEAAGYITESRLDEKGLPKLTGKDERDIAKQLENILNNMDDGTALAFDGEPMDEQTKELVRTAIESNLKLTKQLAKKKFTPKKYRDWE